MLLACTKDLKFRRTAEKLENKIQITLMRKEKKKEKDKAR